MHAPTALARRRTAALTGLTFAAVLVLLNPSAGASAPSATHANWQNVSPLLSTAPPARGGAGFVWDSVADEGVLFGGCNSSGRCYNDTWIYTGSWRNVTASAGPAPSPRGVSEGMAFDAASNETVLFGGEASNGGGLGDTWVFANGTWTDLTPKLPVSPPSRVASSLAYDPVLGGVVLFGGTSFLGAGTFYHDTWLFAHGAWTRLTPGTAPSGRRGAQMTWDPAVNGLVLFGGLQASYRGSSQTWFLRGTNWSRQPFVAPPAQWLGAFQYDAHLSAIVLFGGCTAVGCAAAKDTTYAFVGSGWDDGNARFHLKSSPPHETGMASIYDATTHEVVLFGGTPYSTGTTDNATWVLS